ncbi:hypothetical protein BDZ89DRAFT_509043 [Hymenopellis radicata]|nr:hypothetical protein BDZ89DRAFT_509043 [Hymenopellis radicata]
MDYFSHTADPGYDPILGILPTAESLSHGGYETGALLTEPEHLSPLPIEDMVSPEADTLSSQAGRGIPLGGGDNTQGNTVTTEFGPASRGRTPEPGPRPTRSYLSFIVNFVDLPITSNRIPSPYPSRFHLNPCFIYGFSHHAPSRRSPRRRPQSNRLGML